MELTYGRYLKVEELLQLQQPLSEGPEHDEMLFIIIHQVYELWFKQILHELEKLKSSFQEGERGKALHTLKRIRSILKVLVSQVDVLETMNPAGISFVSGTASIRQRIPVLSVQGVGIYIRFKKPQTSRALSPRKRGKKPS